MKKIQLIIPVLFSLLLVAACTKYHKNADDVSEDGYIRGRLYLADSNRHNYVPKIMANVTVKLSNDTTGENFLYSQKTDSQGYFDFKNLQKRSYSVFAETTDSNYIFYGRISVTPDEKNFIFYLSPKQTDQNGITYDVRDINDQSVAGCTICLFNNYTLAADTVCNGSYWTDATNIFGKATKLNLPSGTYIANFKYSVNGLNYYAKDTVNIDEQGIKYRKVVLIQKQTKKTNQVLYKVVDSLGGIVPGCNVCAFSSFVLANESCTGKNWGGTTDSEGQFVMKSMVAGNYVVFFKAEIGGTTIKRTDTIYNFTDTTNYQKVIHLYH